MEKNKKNQPASKSGETQQSPQQAEVSKESPQQTAVVKESPQQMAVPKEKNNTAPERQPEMRSQPPPSPVKQHNIKKPEGVKNINAAKTARSQPKVVERASIPNMLTVKQPVFSGHTREDVVSPNWDVIHVFGYGESQIVSSRNSNRVQNEQVASLKPFLEHISSILNAGNIRIDDIQALNIYNNNLVSLVLKSNVNNRMQVDFGKIDTKLMNALSSELMTTIS